MRRIHFYSLLLIVVSNTCCGQPAIVPHNDQINYELKDTTSPYGPNTMVRHIRQAKNGDILFAASWGGIFRYDGKSFTNLTSSKLGSRRFWNVLEDRSGNLWMAATDSGVYKFNGKTFEHFTTREGLVDNLVMAIHEDKAGNIWFGSNRYDGKAFQNFPMKNGSLYREGGRVIIEDRTGKLWFATEGGPVIFDGKTFTVLKNNDGTAFKNVWSIIEDKKGNIWFGDIQGLWSYDGTNFIKVSTRGAYSIMQDRQGNIWTTGEVNPMDGTGNRWALSRYDHQSIYAANPVITEVISGEAMDFLGLCEAKDGSIWFGSGAGLFQYDGKSITDFRKKEDQGGRPYFRLNDIHSSLHPSRSARAVPHVREHSRHIHY